MYKIVVVAICALTLAGCQSRSSELVTVGIVGAASGVIIANELSRSTRSVYFEPRYVPVPSHRPRCFSTWERSYNGLVERRVCDRY